MGTLVFGLRAAFLALFKCFEWPDSRSPIDHCPLRYRGQLSPAGNSGLMDLSEEPGRQRNIIIYAGGQRPLSSRFRIGHLDFSVQKSLSWSMGVSGRRVERGLALRKPIIQSWECTNAQCSRFFVMVAFYLFVKIDLENWWPMLIWHKMCDNPFT